MAVGPFAVTRAREAVADFSIPIFSDEHVIFFRRPRIEPDLFGFIKPLGLTVSGIGCKCRCTTKCSEFTIIHEQHYTQRPPTLMILFSFLQVWTTVLASLFIVTAADLVLFAFDQDE